MRVSILVPAYCRPAELRHALASIAVQDQDLVHEILVGDDSPVAQRPGNLDAIAASGLASKIRYFANSPPLGNFPNQADLAARAEGEFVALLHDDDAFHPGALATLTSAASADRQQPSIAAWFGRNSIMDATGTIDLEASRRAAFAYGKAGSGRVEPFWYWALRHSLPPDGFVIRREAYCKYCTGRRDGNVGDFGLLVRLANAGLSGRFLAEDISIYRVHANSQTASERGVDVHLMLELLKELSVPVADEEEKRERVALIAEVATARYLRNGERGAALKCLLLDWPSERRLSLRALAVLAATCVPSTLLKLLARSQWLHRSGRHSSTGPSS